MTSSTMCMARRSPTRTAGSKRTRPTAFANGRIGRTHGRERFSIRCRSARPGLRDSASCCRWVCSRRRVPSPEASSTCGGRGSSARPCCTCATRSTPRTVCSSTRMRSIGTASSRSTGITRRRMRGTSRTAFRAAATRCRPCMCWRPRPMALVSMRQLLDHAAEHGRVGSRRVLLHRPSGARIGASG